MEGPFPGVQARCHKGRGHRLRKGGQPGRPAGKEVGRRPSGTREGRPEGARDEDGESRREERRGELRIGERR